MRSAVVAFVIAIAIIIAVVGTTVHAHVGPTRVVVGGPMARDMDEDGMQTASPVVGGFHAVRANGSIDVHVTRGATAAITFHARPGVMPYLTATVDNGVLTIGMKDGFSGDTGDMSADVHAPTIDGVELNGSGNVDVDEVKSSSFKGSIAGSGNLSARGSADRAAFSVSGSGNIDANDLMCDVVSVSIQGSGNANVHADKKLDAQIAGSGNVNYSGKPLVQQSVEGSGAVQSSD